MASAQTSCVFVGGKVQGFGSSRVSVGREPAVSCRGCGVSRHAETLDESDRCWICRGLAMFNGSLRRGKGYSRLDHDRDQETLDRVDASVSIAVAAGVKNGFEALAYTARINTLKRRVSWMIARFANEKQTETAFAENRGTFSGTHMASRSGRR